jgi:hypothetical protein
MIGTVDSGRDSGHRTRFYYRFGRLGSRKKENVAGLRIGLVLRTIRATRRTRFYYRFIRLGSRKKENVAGLRIGLVLRTIRHSENQVLLSVRSIGKQEKRKCCRAPNWTGASDHSRHSENQVLLFEG